MVGGADRFFFETGRLLEESGHEVAYLSTTHADNETTAFAPYFVKAYDYDSPNPYQRARALAAAVYYREARRSMSRLIDDFRPDVVHVFSIFTHLSTSILDPCMQKGVPVVMSCNDYKHICPNYRLYHHGRVCDDCRGGHFYKALANRCCHESLPFSAASMLEAYSDRLRGSVSRKVSAGSFHEEAGSRAMIKNRQAIRRKDMGNALKTASVFATLFLFLIPLMLVFINSIKSYDQIVANPLSLPIRLDFSNYIKAIAKMKYPSSFMNTLIIAACSVVGIVVFSSMTAHLVVRKDWKFNKLVFFMMVGSIYIPFQAIMIPLLKIYSSIRFLTTSGRSYTCISDSDPIWQSSSIQASSKGFPWNWRNPR